MATTRKPVSISDKRMLRAHEAAVYSGLSEKRFKSNCPVRPIRIGAGRLLWDKLDLDAWIDDLKSTGRSFSHAEILGRLG